YHAKEALHRTTPLIFGATCESKQWATARCTDQNVRCTSFTIALACAIRNFAPKVSVPPPASSRPAAKWQSAPGLSGTRLPETVQLRNQKRMLPLRSEPRLFSPLIVTTRADSSGDSSTGDELQTRATP